MSFIEKNIQLPYGVQLPYIEQGDPSKVSIVFLHGYTGSLREFEPVFDHLPGSVHAIAVTLSSDVYAFMQSKGIRKALIVGHSMGSAVAQRLAIDYPDKVLGLVLAGASVTLPGDPKVQAILDSTISELVDPIDPSFVRQFLTSMRVKPIPDELFEIVVQEALKVPARVWIQAFEGRLLEKIGEELDSIHCPSLLIWGDLDHRSLESDQDALLDAIPDSFLSVYQGAGHLLHLEEPSRFALDVMAFLENTIARNVS